jgi:hypothetical protein
VDSGEDNENVAAGGDRGGDHQRHNALVRLAMSAFRRE